MNKRNSFLVVAACGLLSAATLYPASAAADAMVPSGPITFGPHGSSINSSNWSGYDTAVSGKYSSVEASWVQPDVDCSKGDGYDVWWVGLDGGFHAGNGDVEQEGTAALCQNGQVSYQSWWETAPCLQIQNFSDPVSPGDQIYARTTDNNGQYELYLTDKTKGWIEKPVKQGCDGEQSTSAEVVLETPSYGGTNYANLSDFGHSDFTGSMVNGKPIGESNPEKITLRRKDADHDMDEVSDLQNGTDFGVDWKANS